MNILNYIFDVKNKCIIIFTIKWNLFIRLYSYSINEGVLWNTNSLKTVIIDKPVWKLSIVHYLVHTICPPISVFFWLLPLILISAFIWFWMALYSKAKIKLSAQSIALRRLFNKTWLLKETETIETIYFPHSFRQIKPSDAFFPFVWI